MICWAKEERRRRKEGRRRRGGEREGEKGGKEKEVKGERKERGGEGRKRGEGDGRGKEVCGGVPAHVLHTTEVNDALDHCCVPVYA